MDTTTQNHKLYNLFINGGSITNLDAITKYHIGRLASRISDLINEYGVPVHKEREPNSDGKGFHTRYSMEQCYRERLKNVPLSSVHVHVSNFLNGGVE